MKIATIITLIIFTIGNILAQNGNENQAARTKPNILFFYADDWGRIASIYKDNRIGQISEVVKTPAFDKVANEGVLFENAFFPAPQCTRSRASIATGCYFWETGKTAFLNQQDGFKGYDAGNELTGFGEALKEQGYYIGTSGKTLEKRWTKAEPVPGEKGGYRYSLTIYKQNSPQTREAKQQELADGYRETIQNLLKRANGKPFYFVYGAINTHRPWIRGSGKELWGIEPDNLKGKLPEYLADVPDVREDVADYLGEIQALDLMLGIFMEELEKAGELKNTVIIATGDNGPPGFTRGKTNLYDFGTAAPLMISGPVVNKPGRTITDFVNLMDLAPTFIDIAEGRIPKEMDGKSIFPLLQSEKMGRIDPNRNYVIFGRERHVHNSRPENLSYPIRAIRTDKFTYIINTHNERWPTGNPYEAGIINDPDKLYDLGINGLKVFRDLDASPTKGWVMANRDIETNKKYWEWTFGFRPKEELYKNDDIDQVKNLANNPKYKIEKRKLARQLQYIRQENGDPRLKDIFDGAPWTSPKEQ